MPFRALVNLNMKASKPFGENKSSKHALIFCRMAYFYFISEMKPDTKLLGIDLLFSLLILSRISVSVSLKK